jgi:hypothetical protein
MSPRIRSKIRNALEVSQAVNSFECLDNDHLWSDGPVERDRAFFFIAAKGRLGA